MNRFSVLKVDEDIWTEENNDAIDEKGLFTVI